MRVVLKYITQGTEQNRKYFKPPERVVFWWAKVLISLILSDIVKIRLYFNYTRSRCFASCRQFVGI